jgi:Zn finger protein HypA/HybF involved in hydrogenase expression
MTTPSAPTPPPVTPPPADGAGTSAATEQRYFTCRTCGSQLAYAPGTTALRCQACGAEQHIADAGHTIVEHSYDAWAQAAPKPVATIGKQVLTCRGCGASTESDMLAGACQFCGGVLVAVSNPPGLISPEAVVPFAVDKRAANDAFVKWVRSRWFAPGALKRVGSTEAIAGTYLPHWTFDAHTDTNYEGRRGDHYYTTESYQVSDGKGGSRTETRQVQQTRWSRVSGDVARDFDDLLVPGSTKVPADRLEKAGPWQLSDAVGFEPDYLAGYSAVRYDVDPDSGFASARQQVEDVVRTDCKRDIGGDEQQLTRMNVRYARVMFKLVLLPLWIASYLHGGKTYTVMVNANSGEVIGERPYSWLKIALAVLTTLLLVAAIVAVVLLTRRH